jgi:hypothetical protein
VRALTARGNKQLTHKWKYITGPDQESITLPTHDTAVGGERMDGTSEPLTSQIYAEEEMTVYLAQTNSPTTITPRSQLPRNRRERQHRKMADGSIFYDAIVVSYDIDKA